MSLNVQEYQAVNVRMPCATVRAVKLVARRKGMVKPSGRVNLSEAFRHLVEVALSAANDGQQEVTNDGQI